MTHLPTTALADLLGQRQVMDFGIRPLWTPAPLVSGPAFTVSCPPGDNLMLHAAIYRAPAGSVIVVESGDTVHALAGGNVCAVAQRNGVTAFVLDGMIRDVGEARTAGFPIYGRGVTPVAGAKSAFVPLGGTVHCGGVAVGAGDLVVADEDGVVVVPHDRQAEVLEAARAKLATEEQQSLDEWQAEHRARIEKAINGRG